MIAIVVLFLAGAEPVASPMRSRAHFATVEICEVALADERPRLTELAARLTAQTGRAITYRAACLDLTPGAPA